ncbi:uncharacterized protein J3R85_004555 [Psidium guajava]|nr:uncharacterized protein J3R85_004555 [Psidium guajava]
MSKDKLSFEALTPHLHHQGQLYIKWDPNYSCKIFIIHGISTSSRLQYTFYFDDLAIF